MVVPSALVAALSPKESLLLDQFLGLAAVFGNPGVRGTFFIWSRFLSRALACFCESADSGFRIDPISLLPNSGLCPVLDLRTVVIRREKKDWFLFRSNPFIIVLTVTSIEYQGERERGRFEKCWSRIDRKIGDLFLGAIKTKFFFLFSIIDNGVAESGFLLVGTFRHGHGDFPVVVLGGSSFLAWFTTTRAFFPEVGQFA